MLCNPYRMDRRMIRCADLFEAIGCQRMLLGWRMHEELKRFPELSWSSATAGTQEEA